MDLWRACQCDELNKVKAILRDRPEMAQAPFVPSGMETPLSVAMDAWNLDVVKYLVKTHRAPVIYKAENPCAAYPYCHDCVRCDDGKFQINLHYRAMEQQNRCFISAEIMDTTKYMIKAAYEQNNAHDPEYGRKLLYEIVLSVPDHMVMGLVKFLIEQKGVELKGANNKRLPILYAAAVRHNMDAHLQAQLVTYLMDYRASMHPKDQVRLMDRLIHANNTPLAMVLLKNNGIDLTNPAFKECGERLLNDAQQSKMKDVAEIIINQVGVHVH